MSGSERRWSRRASNSRMVMTTYWPGSPQTALTPKCQKLRPGGAHVYFVSAVTDSSQWLEGLNVNPVHASLSTERERRTLLTC